MDRCGRVHPGPLNLITDIPDLMVGQSKDSIAQTGVTVVSAARSLRMVVDQRGGAPGTAETDLLRLENTVDHVDALVLSGGSAFGLAACDAVRNALVAEKRGFKVGDFHVPIVPGAILFDLMNGGKKTWGDRPPYYDLGTEAFSQLSSSFSMGQEGAGTGARAGVENGGLGSASFIDTETGWTIGALVAVNPVGSVYARDGVFWGAAFAHPEDFPGKDVLSPGALSVARGGYEPDFRKLTVIGTKASGRENTTLAVVATDAPASSKDLKRIAIMAQDGLARAIRPVHTPLDGDIVFAATVAEDIQALDPVQIGVLGSLAADCLARAVMRAVFFAGPDQAAHS